MRRLVERASLVVPALLAAVGLAAWTLGGGVWRLGPLVIGLQRPLRTVALAFVLLLVREAFRDRSGRRACAQSLALLAALLVALAADSQARIVGDGQEYLALTWNLGHGRPPALSSAELVEVERLLDLGAGELSAGREGLRGSDGRQDFHHFWLYPLLGAPLLRAVLAAGGTVFTCLTLLNGLLLLAAAALVRGRLGPGAMLVVFCGPLLWWLDKPHPEVLLIALLVAALAIGDTRPGAALLLVGLAAAQNPVFVWLLAVATLWALCAGPARPRLVNLALAWALAAANPLYFLHRLGHPAPLGETVLPHVPAWRELTAVLVDPNLGLLPAWPSLALLALLAAAVVTRRSLRGESVPWRALGGLALAALALLVAFTWPGNINHGGTRGMSRYALWLLPFAIPALAVLAAAGRAARLAVALLGAGSLLSAFPEYLPSREERCFEPTPLARWVWTRHPGWDRPLPEVFAERAWGYPPLGTVPAGLPGCELALVAGGDGSPLGRWPLPCVPVEKPAFCRRPGALCYAPAHAGGRRFARAPRQPTFPGRERERWWWSGAPAPELVAALRFLPWREFGIVASADEAAFIAERRGCGRLELRTAPGAYLAWFDGVRKEGAFVVPVVKEPRTAILIDPSTGEELSRTPLRPASSSVVALPLRSPLLLVVLASS